MIPRNKSLSISSLGRICLQPSKVYIHQNFLKFVVNVITIGQYNQTSRLCEIPGTVTYSRGILVTVMLESRAKRILCKPGRGHKQTMQTQIRNHRMRRLISVCTVCLNNRSFKWNRLNSRFSIIFSAYIQKQSTNQFCQCLRLFTML